MAREELRCQYPRRSVSGSPSEEATLRFKVKMRRREAHGSRSSCAIGGVCGGAGRGLSERVMGLSDAWVLRKRVLECGISRRLSL